MNKWKFKHHKLIKKTEPGNSNNLNCIEEENQNAERSQKKRN